MNNAINLQNVSKEYEDFTLRKVSFQVPQGFITGFIGPNGSGKTTTIKCILDLVHMDGGKIELFGYDKNIHSLNKEIGVVMDTPFFMEEWACRDVERAVAPFYPRWDNKKYASLLKEFRISPEKKVKDLSRGMKVKLMLAVALSHDAKLLILDEPTSGLDPSARDELRTLFSDYIQEEDHTILFSTHITTDLEKIADYIVFLINGTVVFSGEKEELMEAYVMVKGDPLVLTESNLRKLMGLRTYSSGFEAMVKREDISEFAGACLIEEVSLDEIIVFMNKEVQGNGTNA